MTRRLLWIAWCIAAMAFGLAILLSGCGGEPPPEPDSELIGTLPLGLPCDPEDQPEALPGCMVCPSDGFLECCAEIPEGLACLCADPRGDDDFRWYFGSCRSAAEAWPH